MLSRLVLGSRHVLRQSYPRLTKQVVRTMALNPEDRYLYQNPPGIPQVVESGEGVENVRSFDPKTQSLEDFLNIRFGPDMPTINDDKNPQRDVKNYPRIGVPEVMEKTRFYVLPDSWFQAFYEKTGVTGPYVFGATFITFLLSKEIYVIEHEIFTGLSLIALTALGTVKLGPKIRTWYCEMADAEKETWDNWQKDMKEFLQNMIANQLASQEDSKSQILFDAKRENIKLQLEAEFRRRQMVAYNEVRNRLEYLLAKQVAERQFQQQHMVNWIIDNVAKSISAQSDKDVLQKCLSDLKQLASKQQISLI